MHDDKCVDSSRRSGGRERTPGHEKILRGAIKRHEPQ